MSILGPKHKIGTRFSDNWIVNLTVVCKEWFFSVFWSNFPQFYGFVRHQNRVWGFCAALNETLFEWGSNFE